MKNPRKIPSALLVFLLAAGAACNSRSEKVIAERRPPSPATAAEIIVMARHDSLMAQTDQLFSLKAEVAAAHSPVAAPYLRGLAAADAAMMDWMHQYRAPDSTAAAATRLVYFQQQQQVLSNVSRQYRATMDSATLFISQQRATTAPAAVK